MANKAQVIEQPAKISKIFHSNEIQSFKQPEIKKMITFITFITGLYKIFQKELDSKDFDIQVLCDITIELV